MSRPAVALRPMTLQERRTWIREQGIPGYAHDIVRADALGPQAARAKAEADYAGLDTDGDVQWRVAVSPVDGEHVAVGGVAWRVTDDHGERVLFVMDVEVYPRFRGQGLGRALMTAVVEEARAAGVQRVGLTVWEGNDVARPLYESLGFRPVSTAMSLRLPG